jgi:hypothetical protein
MLNQFCIESLVGFEPGRYFCQSLATVDMMMAVAEIAT